MISKKKNLFLCYNQKSRGFERALSSMATDQRAELGDSFFQKPECSTKSFNLLNNKNEPTYGSFFSKYTPFTADSEDTPEYPVQLISFYYSILKYTMYKALRKSFVQRRVRSRLSFLNTGKLSERSVATASMITKKKAAFKDFESMSKKKPSLKDHSQFRKRSRFVRESHKAMRLS